VPSERLSPSAAASGRKTRLRVVVIEDNEDAAVTLQDVLELEGHEVAIAHDGRRGIETVLEWQPDVVLCDVGLPDIDGLEVGARLRAAGFRARLVAVTGYASPADIERSRRAGFDEHVAKPVDPGQLDQLLGIATDPAV